METSAFFVITLIYLLLSAVTTALDEKDVSIVFRSIVKREDADLTLENFPNPRSDLMACRRDGKPGYFCDPGRFMADGEGKGFCQVKKNPKIREKLGSGWVGQAPNRILIFSLKCCVFFVLFSCFQLFQKKKWIKRVGAWVGSDQSAFFSDFFYFFNLIRPLSVTWLSLVFTGLTLHALGAHAYAQYLPPNRFYIH